LQEAQERAKRSGNRGQPPDRQPAMIASLSGKLIASSPLQAVLDVNGIGFKLTIPLSTSRSLGAAGCATTLHVQSVFTRAGLSLYGFATAEEKATFNRLTEVKGIGPKAALSLLSRFSPQEIVAVITEGRLETLESVPGIGPKRASMLLGKLKVSEPERTGSLPYLEDAVAALVSLGLTRGDALARLDRVPNRDQLSLNELLTRALKATKSDQ
jgi:Holliday junction DNA helicase RuvA